MADASVRPASPGDAPAIAAVQGAVWSQVYAGVLPAEVLAGAAGPDALAAWERAVALPPSSRHAVLVADAGGEVVGFAAVAPSEDLSPGEVELQALCVAPDRAGAGHGSRLVNAVADVLSGLGVTVVRVWVSPYEQVLRRFLEKAGWAEDGARRQLDLHGDGSVVVDQVRLAVSIAEHG